MADSPILPHDLKPDEVQLFMLYSLFGGDTKRVAVVSQVDKAIIDSLAHDFHWKEKAGGRQRFDTDAGKEHERVLNRVTTYVTAERLSRVFSRLIADLDSDPSFGRAFCTAVDGEGNTSFSAKNIVDLAKGVQICSDVKYRALGDKLAQEADVSGSPKTAAELGLAAYRALANRFDQNVSVDTATQFQKAVSTASDKTDDDPIVPITSGEVS